MGSCVWAFVEPAQTRTPTEPGFKLKPGWRRARIFAWGPPFKRVWVQLYRPIGGKDAEVALRISSAKTKPRSNGAGMTPAQFRAKAGKMGKYKLESCRT
jgi:hypothetical protein